MTTITVGPVIGAVDSTTARVLVEFNTNGIMTMELVNAANPEEKVTVAKPVKGGHPSIFTFTSLKPSTKYNVTFPYSDAPDRTGAFVANP